MSDERLLAALGKLLSALEDFELETVAAAQGGITLTALTAMAASAAKLHNSVAAILPDLPPDHPVVSHAALLAGVNRGGAIRLLSAVRPMVDTLRKRCGGSLN